MKLPIMDSTTQKKAELKSHRSTAHLIHEVGEAIAPLLQERYGSTCSYLFVCGLGNNGADGCATVLALRQAQVEAYCCFPSGKPKTGTGATLAKKVLPYTLSSKQWPSLNNSKTILVECLFGFSYHGNLKPNARRCLDTINQWKGPRISLDINAGCEADTGVIHPGAFVSDATIAIGAYKPFHLLAKQLGVCAQVIPLDLHLPKMKTNFCTMDEQHFFKAYPRRSPKAYKGQEGHTLIWGGSYGMAGAVTLNLWGAYAAGVSYIDALVDESIYPLVAPHAIPTVFHPIHESNFGLAHSLLPSSSALCLGSGMTHLSYKRNCLEAILQEATCPAVLDAEALAMLVNNLYLLQYAKSPLVLTPHLMEFSRLIQKPISEVSRNLLQEATDFAKHYQVILVLKGPNTLVVSPKGQVYINQTGNAVLATAGSGDYLTGLLTGLLTLVKEPYQACCMAVWLHGVLGDQYIQAHSQNHLDFQELNRVADAYFKAHQPG